MTDTSNLYAVCDPCGWRDSNTGAYRNLADHYREEGHVPRVEWRGEERNVGALSVCMECDFIYNHGAEYVDVKRADDHREHGGDVLGQPDGHDPDGHAVALLDVARGCVLTYATTTPQHDPEKDMPTLAELREESESR